MSNNRLYATTTTVADIASRSLANYETMAQVVVYPGMQIRYNTLAASSEACAHAEKIIRRANKRFLRRDEPFAIAALPISAEDGLHILEVYIPYTSEYAVRYKRVRKGLFNSIHTSVYEKYSKGEESSSVEYIRF